MADARMQEVFFELAQPTAAAGTPREAATSHAVSDDSIAATSGSRAKSDGAQASAAPTRAHWVASRLRAEVVDAVFGGRLGHLFDD